MNNAFEQKAGISLIVFTILLVFTMVMHPAGGSVQHLIRITPTIIVTHAIALLSLPFGWIGFRGLTRRLGAENYFSVLAFSMISFGLLAVMLAATTNGIVLPLFLQSYKDAVAAEIETLRPILGYSFAMNHAFDYIYTIAFSLAILCWSLAILRTKRLAGWVGWFGVALAVIAVVVFGSGLAVNELIGFRVFVMGVVAWVVIAGIALCRQASE